MALLESAVPQSTEDFERLVVSNPASSFRWIKYIAYQVSMAEVEKARLVVKRALKAIPSTEEGERFNVWVAYLNLEHMYGEPMQLQRVLKDAVQYNEPQKIYTEMAKIYAETEHIELAKNTHKLILKKFPSPEAFFNNARFLHDSKAGAEEVQALLSRALERLPKRLHLQVISKFAQLEFRLGTHERGRTMMEGILQSFPKKVDMWSVYLDMEIKRLRAALEAGGDASDGLNATRHIFQRVIVLPISSKKAKFFFKRYLEFERQFGDEDTVEEVKNLAREYVLSRTQQQNDD